MLKIQANEIHTAAMEEEDSLLMLNATQQQIEDASTEFILISDIYKLVEGLAEDQLVPIEIDFSNFFSSVQKIPSAQKLKVPVRFKNYNLEIEVQAQELRDHKRVMEIIKNELEVHLQNNHSTQQEALRLEELRKMQQERLRERRESDASPATAIHDGQGTILQIGRAHVWTPVTL